MLPITFGPLLNFTSFHLGSGPLCYAKSTFAYFRVYTAPNALADLKSKLKGFFKSKNGTKPTAKPADKPAEVAAPVAAATATAGEAPTATKDAVDPTPAAAGKPLRAITILYAVTLTDLSL